MSKETRYVVVTKIADDEGECWTPSNDYFVESETLTLQDILNADKGLRDKTYMGLAQGYSTKENEHKTMDATLCTAQADAIIKMLGEQQ
jgi:hypothetical protein